MISRGTRPKPVERTVPLARIPARPSSKTARFTNSLASSSVSTWSTAFRATCRSRTWTTTTSLSHWSARRLAVAAALRDGAESSIASRILAKPAWPALAYGLRRDPLSTPLGTGSAHVKSLPVATLAPALGMSTRRGPRLARIRRGAMGRLPGDLSRRQSGSRRIAPARVSTGRPACHRRSPGGSRRCASRCGAGCRFRVRCIPGLRAAPPVVRAW